MKVLIGTCFALPKVCKCPDSIYPHCSSGPSKTKVKLQSKNSVANAFEHCMLFAHRWALNLQNAQNFNNDFWYKASNSTTWAALDIPWQRNGLKMPAKCFHFQKKWDLPATTKIPAACSSTTNIPRLFLVSVTKLHHGRRSWSLKIAV